MKNKIFMRFVTVVAFLAMISMSASNVFAVAPDTSVVSPYWQTDSDSYTFVAVSHPSLTGVSSEVGVVLTAFTQDGTTTFGTTAFTVGESATSRIFIVATNHSTINSTNITGTDAVFVTGTTNSTHGSLVFTPRSSNPRLTRENAASQQAKQITDITALSFWGAVVVSSANSGFAMEFIGDTHDSQFTALTSTGQTLKSVGLN